MIRLVRKLGQLGEERDTVLRWILMEEHLYLLVQDSPVGTSSQCFLIAHSPAPPMEREERAKSQAGAKGLLGLRRWRNRWAQCITGNKASFSDLITELFCLS